MLIRTIGLEAEDGLFAQYLVDQTVFFGFRGRHPVVTVAVLLDLLVGLTGMVREDVVQVLLDLLHLLEYNHDERGLALRTTEGLVNHYAAVRQSGPLALGAGGQQHGAHGSGHARTDRRDVRRDVLHGVINREAIVDGATGRDQIDEDVDFIVRRLQKEQLGHDDVRDLAVDARAKEDDPVHHETGEYIHGDGVHLPLFDDVRRQVGDLAVQMGGVAVHGHAADSHVLDRIFFKFAGIHKFRFKVKIFRLLPVVGNFRIVLSWFQI